MAYTFPAQTTQTARPNSARCLASRPPMWPMPCKSRARILRYLEQRGVITLDSDADSDVLTVSEELAERAPALSQPSPVARHFSSASCGRRWRASGSCPAPMASCASPSRSRSVTARSRSTSTRCRSCAASSRSCRRTGTAAPNCFTYARTRAHEVASIASS